MEGFQAGWAVEHAARLVLSGQARALITGPIHKARLQAGGYPFSGHTDLLGSLCLAPENTMMLANEQLRVALVTVHTALARVSRGLTQEAVLRAISQTHESLQKYFGIPVPKIAVLALNPHAGEGGLFGSEEIKVIRPAIAQARRHFGKNAKISGPHPADTLFAQHILARPRDRYDAVVCMYHDQGLIPVKLLDFPKTVNITLGLPMIRTSVDHGTAFDIAGRNLADPSSLISAILLAVKMDRARSTRGVMKKMASSRSKRK
jgi:4-hydroxythreonine-4-phosphate dehydrogenase